MMSLSKEEIPREIEQEVKAALPKQNTYKYGWIDGKIGDITIGTCSSNNHAQDEHGVAATGASITDYDPSTDFHVFAYREKKLLWIKLMGSLYSSKIEGNRIKMFCHFVEHRPEKQRPHTRTYYLDPTTGQKIEED